MYVNKEMGWDIS
ncbi:MAG: hypothetical protein MTP17_01315 [Candidatus Midichloria sp.]|nr:MAG: hypothetical protein MTP17_01315 [Candidatus Midichloria sp.]